MITRIRLSTLGESTRVHQGFEQTFYSIKPTLPHAIRVLQAGVEPCVPWEQAPHLEEILESRR